MAQETWINKGMSTAHEGETHQKVSKYDMNSFIHVRQTKKESAGGHRQSQINYIDNRSQ
jgi:hypothetical protein